MMSVSNVSFQSTVVPQVKADKKVKDKKPNVISTTLKFIIGTSLTALALSGIYLITKNAKSAKSVLEFIKSNEMYKDVEPIITKLKNSRTKIEFKLDYGERHLYVAGKGKRTF